MVISPSLAKQGKANFEGLGVNLIGSDFTESLEDRLRYIILANPYNVVLLLKDHLSSKKIGPIIYNNLANCQSVIQKHLISLFLIYERPDGWQKELFQFMNLLHKNSFILSDLFNRIRTELKFGFVTDEDASSFMNLVSIVAAKHKYSGISTKTKLKRIPDNQTINTSNKLPVDKILAETKNLTFSKKCKS